jgi:hypothetical protein
MLRFERREELQELEMLEFGTDPRERDSDRDDLLDGKERDCSLTPTDPDTDDDGLSDGEEVNFDCDNTDGYETDPLEPDTDGDDLPDGIEAMLRTDPKQEDTDGGRLDRLPRSFRETNESPCPRLIRIEPRTSAKRWPCAGPT